MKRKVKKERNRILTTELARKAFFSALENPSPPNDALIAAFKKHQELVSNKVIGESPLSRSELKIYR